MSRLKVGVLSVETEPVMIRFDTKCDVFTCQVIFLLILHKLLFCALRAVAKPGFESRDVLKETTHGSALGFFLRPYLPCGTCGDAGNLVSNSSCDSTISSPRMR